jgi:hypothetical protein
MNSDSNSSSEELEYSIKPVFEQKANVTKPPIAPVSSQRESEELLRNLVVKFLNFSPTKSQQKLLMNMIWVR